MNIHDLVKTLQNYWHSLVSELKPALDYVEANGGKAVLLLAEGVLTGVASGTPWGAIVASLVAAAEAQGITLAQGTASVILNLAKANLDAKNAA